jgi:GT2 family glycosyltransferase
MSIGVVIPTYNRRDNLLLAISALSRQSCQDFYLVVSDNGSNDGTYEAITALKQTAIWQERLIWVGFIPERDRHPSRARNRNKGVAHLPPDCTLICFLDSDVLLNPAGLAHYAHAHAAQPDALILGVVDWLPPRSLDEIRPFVDSGRLDLLRQQLPPGISQRVEGTYVGFDMRPRTYPGRFSEQLHAPQAIIEKCFWTTNLGCPITAWQRLGGFDETIVEYGPEDIEFGCQARQQGLRCLYNTSVWALHVWHPKANTAEVNYNSHQNLGRIVERYGLETFVPSLAQTKDSLATRLSGGHQLTDEQKVMLALKLRQKREQQRSKEE